MLQTSTRKGGRTVRLARPLGSDTLSAAEVQEIFLLEESLASLAHVSAAEVGNVDLLSILDALYLGTCPILQNRTGRNPRNS